MRETVLLLPKFPGSVRLSLWYSNTANNLSTWKWTGGSTRHRNEAVRLGSISEFAVRHYVSMFVAWIGQRLDGSLEVNVAKSACQFLVKKYLNPVFQPHSKHTVFIIKANI